MKFNTLVSTAIIASTGLAAPSYGGKCLTPGAIEAVIEIDGMKKDLSALYDVAMQNGGNRAFGLPGYKASVDYILSQLAPMSSWVDFSTQSFTATFEQTRNISVTGPAGESVFVLTLQYNTPTPLPGGITAPLIFVDGAASTGGGCLASDWEGVDATGKIALIKRGVCALADKLKLAKAHGALAAIIFNQNPGTNFLTATLSLENVGKLVPAGVIPLEVGDAWRARLALNETLVANIVVDSFSEERETWNVIAETKAGDPASVVMFGGHLDSVPAGPGINDDGTGSAANLAILRALEHFQGENKWRNKIRFAWWAAEEGGMIGSLHYTRGLAAGEAARLKAYFNYDMIGSIEPTWEVLDGYKARGPGGVGQGIYDYLTAQMKPVVWSEVANNSDYEGFLELAVPTTDLHTGIDACYHTACDGIDNVDWDALLLMTKAAARAAAQYAQSVDSIPLRAREAVASLGEPHEHVHFARDGNVAKASCGNPSRV